MAMDAKRLVGRVAKLTGLVSKSELNEQAVLIGAYDVEKQRYAAQTLADPNNETAAVSVAVKRANIQLYSDSFEDQFPNARVVKGFVEPGRQRGTIMDVSTSPRIVPVENNVLVIIESCMIRGAPATSKGSTHPSTVISTTVVIHAEADAIIEFEGIDFDVQFAQGAVHCHGGRVTFRRCCFKSLESGCTVDNASAVFENCVFEDCTGSGIIVAGGAHMILRNCHIRNTHMGVEVRNGGAAELFHCSISHSRGASTSVYAKGKSLSLQNCLIESAVDSGVLVTDGGSIDISNSRVQNCGMAGVAVEGPSRTTALISNTVLTQNQHGLLVQTGKSNVNVERCKLVNNKRYGLFVGQDAIGDIFVTGTSITGNRAKQINNDGGPKSALHVDGIVHAQDGLMATLAWINPEVAQRTVDAALKCEASLGQRTALETIRARKLAGVGTVHCAACGSEEPPKVKFNKCSRCLEYCYCSKKCQVRRGVWFIVSINHCDYCFGQC